MAPYQDYGGQESIRVSTFEDNKRGDQSPNEARNCPICQAPTIALTLRTGAKALGQVVG